MTDLEQDLAYALAAMVRQNCRETEWGLNSDFLTYHANAIRLLCEIGAMELTDDASTRSSLSQRDVTAKFVGRYEQLYGTGVKP